MKIGPLANELWRTMPHLFAEKISGGKWVPYHHLAFISEKIAEEVAQGGARIVIEAPPRHGKSLLISKWAPVWFLAMQPEKSVVLASYEAGYAANWGREVRNVVAEHSEALGFSLREDSKAAARWNTDHGGGMMTAGVGGPLTGKGADLAIIDDPVKNWEDAMSPLMRLRTVNWFESVLYTRLEPGASIVLLMTRWHQRDLAGFLLSEHSDRWTHIRLPAVAKPTAERPDPLGREPGEALCPERYDEAALTRIYAAIGPRKAAALYDQEPSPDEGGDIKRTYMKAWQDLPERFDQLIQSWDMSFKDKKDSDFVVGQVWGRKGSECFLIHQIRARLDLPGSIAAVRAMHLLFPLASAILVEGKANGPAVMQTLKKEIPGLIEVEPDGSKESRVAAVSPYWEAGNVLIPDWTKPEHQWVKDFVEEVVGFPGAPHDDQVDTMTQALSRLRGKMTGAFSKNMLQTRPTTIAGRGAKW